MELCHGMSMSDWDELSDLQMVDEVEDSVGPLLSTGSSLLNLACSDSIVGGFQSGQYYLLVGDAAAGKTMLAITCLAEAHISKEFGDHRLIYDNIEAGCAFDFEKLFCQELADKLESPHPDKDKNPGYSSTVEEFYYHLDDAIKQGDPFIYVLDSMDALTTKPDDEKFVEHRKAAEAGRKAAGSYGMSKARLNSEGIRRALRGLRDTDSILLIIAQTRDNVGFGFTSKTRGGGRALEFYGTHAIWMSLAGQITKRVRGKDRVVGVKVKVRVKKNRTTGRLHEVTFNIHPTCGIDDTGSLVDYLVEEGIWKGAKSKKGKIQATSLPSCLEMGRDDLIAELESRDLIEVVKREAQSCWQQVEEASRVHRRNRFQKVENE